MTLPPPPGRAPVPRSRVLAALRLAAIWLGYRLDREKRQALILELLGPDKELGGRELQALSGGRLGRQVYGDLEHLEADGILLMRWDPPLALGYIWQRKVYRLRGDRRPVAVTGTRPALGIA